MLHSSVEVLLDRSASLQGGGGGVYLSQSPKSQIKGDGWKMGELRTLGKSDVFEEIRRIYGRKMFGLAPVLPAQPRKALEYFIQALFCRVARLESYSSSFMFHDGFIAGSRLSGVIHARKCFCGDFCCLEMSESD